MVVIGITGENAFQMTLSQDDNEIGDFCGAQPVGERPTSQRADIPFKGNPSPPGCPQRSGLLLGSLVQTCECSTQADFPV